MEKSYIYKIKNSINDKVYIGCTTKTIVERFKEHIKRSQKNKHKTKLYNSFKKYGIENFTIEVVEECNKKIMFIKEIEYIKEYDSYYTGLNSTKGGEGCLGYKHTDETREKISIKTKEKSHKDKTYEEIYSEKSDDEKEKRKEGVKKYWDSLDDDEKEKRTTKTKEKNRQKSKYDIETIIEIKKLIQSGLKNREIHKIFPEVKVDYLSSIRSGRRWKDV
jgi:group I intron endonuclease